MNKWIKIIIAEQKLQLLHDEKVIKTYLVSTAKLGVGEVKNSYKTPRGWHIIRAKIGAGCQINTVFVARRPTGEVYSESLAKQYPERDWILTRILWLSGLEIGKNRLGDVDTMQRFIYIHGTPEINQLGTPNSHGCIRMHNQDLLEVFDFVEIGTRVLLV